MAVIIVILAIIVLVGFFFLWLHPAGPGVSPVASTASSAAALQSVSPTGSVVSVPDFVVAPGISQQGTIEGAIEGRCGNIAWQKLDPKELQELRFPQRFSSVIIRQIPAMNTHRMNQMNEKRKALFSVPSFIATQLPRKQSFFLGNYQTNFPFSKMSLNLWNRPWRGILFEDRLYLGLALLLCAHFFAEHGAGNDFGQAAGKRGLRGQVGFGEQRAVEFAAHGHIEKARHHFGLRHFTHQRLELV